MFEKLIRQGHELAEQLGRRVAVREHTLSRTTPIRAEEAIIADLNGWEKSSRSVIRTVFGDDSEQLREWIDFQETMHAVRMVGGISDKTNQEDVYKSITLLHKFSSTAELKRVLMGAHVKAPVSTVLWLSANPPINDSLDRLDLEEEIHAVENQLSTARYRDQVRFMLKAAVRPFDVVHAVSDSNPDVVHFSGHGSYQGIVLREDGGGYILATTDWLRGLFAERGVKLVVLNSCFSRAQAEAISKVVPCVIGTTENVNDKAAIRFSQMFYRRLADGVPIKIAAQDARLLARVKDGEDVYIEYGGTALHNPIVLGLTD